ncbi:MAG: sulfate adenylyltransferase [Candidatus Heimdallarchaeota archaeon]
MVNPHGGQLSNCVLAPKQIDSIVEEIPLLPRHPIDLETYIEIENISIGTLSPLEGYMRQDEFEAVLETGRLPNGLAWTIPITLDIREKQAAKYEKGARIALSYRDEIIGICDIEDKFLPDKKQWAKMVFGTTDTAHPGVDRVFKKEKTLVGGAIRLLKHPPVPFPERRLTPKETRVLFKSKGWRTVVGFQTRNAPHIGHEYVQKAALTFVDGIFINPVIGKKKKGDFKDEVILKSYQTLIDHYYLHERSVLATLLTEMRYAGPREAILHAIIRKNFGCTHFIIGRDHAGVGNYYPPFAAQEIFDDYPDIGIIPLFFKSFSYCTRCGSVVNEKICPHPPDKHVNFSGTKIREMLLEGKHPPKEQMRPEVADVILQYDHPFVD